jgi:hypothetical protein
MAYTAEISRSNPGCIVFLVDHSASMSDPIGGSEVPQRKADVVSDAINRLLTELSIKCAKEEGVRDYFHVAVIGYGHRVGSAYGGTLAGRDLVPLSEVADNPAEVQDRAKKVPDGVGGLVETKSSFPIWMYPVANGGTPMVAALRHAQRLVSGWLEIHPGGFPPIILNLSDGESTDGDPSAAASELTTLASADGSSLLFNLHVSSAGGAAVEFPDSDAALTDQYAKLLYSISSPLPEHMRVYAGSQGKRVSEATRGFVYNADIGAVVQFLDIGTRATDLR